MTRWLHHHRWRLIATSATTLVDKFTGTMSEYLAERILLGVTTYLFQCDVCLDLRREECLGQGQPIAEARP
jgi:hypothetical protein